MRRIVYIILAFILIACSKNEFDYVCPENVIQTTSSEITPCAYVNPVALPPAATKALIGAATVSNIHANVLRLDENPGYIYDGWENAYLIESISSPSASSATSQGGGYLRTMSLNPVQGYRFAVDSNNDTTFYHTRMLSWHPMTCPLYKNDEGKAVITKFSDYKSTVNDKIYEINSDGDVVLRFSGLDGSKDVMVSNVVEGQHWHSDDGTSTYTYPFGQNDAMPRYSNYMTYKHYLSAIKVYAYTDNSDQVVSMWGALKSVMVKNQPSEVMVTLPRTMEDPEIIDYVQENSLDYGDATFGSSLVDFPLIKTPMYGPDDNSPENQEIAEDAPLLEHGKMIYLGYALIQPRVMDGQELELDIHTESGVLSVSVPMTATVGGNEVNYFEPGYIYNIQVNFNTEGAIADIVLKSGEEHYYDLSASMEFGEDVHDYKYANCYIVTPDIKRENGDNYDGYAFSATTVGNGTLGIYSTPGFDRNSALIEPVRAGLLWESSQRLITQVEYLYGYVRFKVPDIGTKEGNAVIAVYDSERKILWSWHIWITDTPEDITHQIGSSEIVLLDRNLGATSTSEDDLLNTYGLYYQWGRKDPSMGPKSDYYLPQSTETAEYYDYYGIMWNYAGVVNLPQPSVRDGVENPMYLVLPTDFSMTTYQYDWLYTNVDNLWGDYDHSSPESTSQRQKTIYDPCPFGYMVPQDEISTLFSGTVTKVDGKGMKIAAKESGQYSFFPFAGYKGVDKGVSSLTGAWRYVGQKGDYMSSKIEGNGHRSRTYISNASTWVEYGADSDNDGDGDASRTYSSNISADDVANRRTAGSIRCVKRTNALNTSLYVSFTGDKTYAFVDDADNSIKFDYDVKVYGPDVKIQSSYIEYSLNGVDYTSAFDLEAESKTEIDGTLSLDLPTSPGLVRYRLVTVSSTGAVSRVAYVVRLFDIDNLMVGGVPYTSDTECKYGSKYTVSFDLSGIDSDFTVLVNGVNAVRGDISTDSNGISKISYSVSGVYIPGHIHLQILDADGGQACTRTYEVKMATITGFTQGAEVIDVEQLEAGALYMIRTYSSNSIFNPRYYYLTNNDGKLELDESSTPSESNMFFFHRDDTRAGGVASSYRNVCAGAWMNFAANADSEGNGFIKYDFTFGPESEAVYMTCANGWNQDTSEDIALFQENTGNYLYYSNRNLRWGSGRTYKWRIYKVTVQ